MNYKYVYTQPSKLRALKHDDLGFSDTLCHAKKGEEVAGHKYTSREWKNGSWQYIYDHTFGRRKKKEDLQNKIDYYDYLINRTLQDKIDVYSRKVDKILKDYPDAKSAYSDNHWYYQQYADKLKELQDEQQQAKWKLEDLEKEFKSY